MSGTSGASSRAESGAVEPWCRAPPRGHLGSRRIRPRCAHWGRFRRRLPGARDGVAGNVHIGAPSVARPHQTRDTSRPNVHIGAPFVATLFRGCDAFAAKVHIAAPSVARGVGRATNPGVVRTPARRNPQQCAHWWPFCREKHTLPALLSPRGAHSPRFRREVPAGREGGAGNVHIGAASVAGGATNLRPMCTSAALLSRIPWECATTSAPMCTSVPNPSQVLGGPTELATMCTSGPRAQRAHAPARRKERPLPRAAREGPMCDVGAADLRPANGAPASTRRTSPWGACR